MYLNSELKKLASHLKGELKFDHLNRHLYATDASVYRELPLAVAWPKSNADIKALSHFARENNITLIPRAAGTSLAGQCVGDGLVVDVSKYMNDIIEFNEKERWVRAQPGVVRDELNAFLKPYGLFFGPNTSTANRCNVGGMVGNNSCGTTSIVYGSTRDHVLELKTILSDGSEAIFSSKSQVEFQEKCKDDSLEGDIYNRTNKILSNDSTQDLIISNYPKRAVSRRNTGYALDALVELSPYNNEGRPFNMCKLLCGSEGTLAFTTEIKLNLVPLPPPKDVVIAAHFSSIQQSLKATVIAMQHSPDACELMDKRILDCTKDNIEQSKNRFFVQGEPEAMLMIELRSKSMEDALDKANRLISELKQSGLGYAFPIIRGKDTSKVWSLRSAGLGVLANIPGDAKAVACIEDTAVAVEDLPEYIEAFGEMMKSYGQEVVHYAHAGAGELHLRPILNLKKAEQVKLFREISEASAKLVKRFNGSLSGEHGDGRVRSEFIPIVLGDEIYELLKQIKEIWDPQGIFNKGKIVNAPPMDTQLRYKADTEIPEFDTIMDFSKEGGILRATEKCNGSGDCRKLNFSGGIMCPSYRATKDEKDSTRGRANVLREFLTMNVKRNPFDHPEIETAMDLCLSCKGCKSECPSNIDMAAMKSEFLYQYGKTHGQSLRSKLIANSASINKILAIFPGFYNSIQKLAWFKSWFGFSKARTLPSLYSHTFTSWFKKFDQVQADRSVYLFFDEFTNYYDVEIGIKAVKLLNTLGYHIKHVYHPESGRAAISKGFLKKAKSLASRNVELFSELISKDQPLIGIEPSAILSFRDEYPKLVDQPLRNKAESLSENVYLIDEFLAEVLSNDRFKSLFESGERTILVHGHCHQRVLSDIYATERILSYPENYQVKLLNTGCCGMAGSFGMEKEHYQLSQEIGNQVLFPAVRKKAPLDLIAASGTSCRHQILDGTSEKALHPVEVLYDALLD